MALHIHVHTRDGSVEETMREYKQGQLHSGSKRGPVVKKRKQAIAIALKQAGKSNQDAETKYDPPHDPKTGQFTSTQHSEQAAHHRKIQVHHETEAKKHGETSMAPYGSHGNAGAQHYSAAFYHEKAAQTGDPEHVKQAHRYSKLATQASKKVASQGAGYQTPASKTAPAEKPALTSQQHSARRIERYLRENRIRLR